MSTNTQPQYTMLVFLTRNPAISPAEFRAHYEAHHAPMVIEMAKTAKGLVAYTRRYLNHEASDPALGNPFTMFREPVPRVSFDVVIELTFETKEDAAEFERLMYDVDENRKRFQEDENYLFDNDQMRGMIVETLVSI